MNQVSIVTCALLLGAPMARAQADATDAPRLIPGPQGLIKDDLSVVTPAWASLSELAGDLRDVSLRGGTPEGGLREPQRFEGEVPAKVQEDLTAFSGYSVDGLLTAPLYDDRSDPDRVLTRIRRMKGAFGPDGFTALPAFGRAADRSFRVHFDLESVGVGGAPIAFDDQARVERQGDVVTLDHGAVRAVYRVGLDAIEQTFVFDALPGEGSLVVEVDVDSNLAAADGPEGLQFVHPTLGGVHYGDAFVVDAAGRRAAMERTWTGVAIQLVAPADFLVGATFPVTVDPPVTTFISTAGTPDDSNVDICFAGGQTEYWTVFQDYFDGTQSDCYAISLSTAGVVDHFVSVEIGADDWTDPKIAYHVNSNRCLVVASEVSGGFGAIQGQLIDCAAGVTTGGPFTISTLGALKVHPDVGGNNWDAPFNAHFCVVWSSVWTVGSNHQIQYRLVDFDGTLVTGVTGATAFGGGQVHNEPAISESHGDADLTGDWWTATWVEDTDNNGFGDVLARRIAWSGDPAAGAGNFVVGAGGNCSHPRVSSRFNRPLVGSPDRPSVVVYERDFPTLSGPPRQRSIYGAVVTDGFAEPESAISFVLEDFDGDLDQREPAIACDGNCFYLTYAEEWWGAIGSGDYDMYMLSGCISDLHGGGGLALAERHRMMTANGTAERNGAVATIWDGSSNNLSDDGMAIWEDQNVVNGGTLEGATLEIPTTQQSIVRAVGRQFCDANPHFASGVSGRLSSWLWMVGDQSVSSNHSLVGLDLPPSTFALAFASRTPGNMNMPAPNNVGRLCVLDAGRYNSQIQSSTSSGQISIVVDPQALPLPTGLVSAAPGETWYFQVWHRDLDGGLPSSNFSSAVAMQFTN